MKRLLFVSGYPNPVDRYLYIFFRNLIHAIADTGVECHVVSPVSATRYKDKLKAIPKTSVDTTSNGSKVYVYYPRYISASAKKIAGFNTGKITSFNYVHTATSYAKKLNIKFDAVYGHFFVSGGLSAISIGRKLGIPSFVAYGECDYESQVTQLYRRLRKSDIKGLTGIISVSQKNTNELKNEGIFDDIPIITCENAVEMSLFNRISKNEAREKYGFKNDDFIVGFVGGFIERKGDKRLLEACKNIDGVSLAFAGKGSEAPSGDNVIFCSSVNHEEIGDFLSSLDVFALPTLNEGCCNAVLEAMASGLAIVSSDLPFNDGVLTNENSIRINPNSIDEIREAIIKLKEDDSLRNSLSQKAKEDSQNFTIEKRAEKILNFMSGCVQ